MTVVCGGGGLRVALGRVCTRGDDSGGGHHGLQWADSTDFTRCRAHAHLEPVDMECMT